MKQRTKAVLLLAASAWSAMALTTSGARADVVRHSGSDVYWLDMPGYDTGEIVPSASGLIRTEQAVAGWVDTEGLPPNTVVTLWWAIFNEPPACKHPTPVALRRPRLLNRGELVVAAVRQRGDDRRCGNHTHGRHARGGKQGGMRGPSLQRAA